MKKSVLRAYAKLIVSTGVNVQKGQTVIVYAGLDQPEFVELVVRECYRAGAAKVNVEWSHQPLQKMHVNCRSLKVLSHVEEWEKAKLQYRVDKLPAMLYLISEDPDGLSGSGRFGGF